MNFMVAVLQPACTALRFIDQSRIRTKDVNNVWDGLESALIRQMMREEFSTVSTVVKKYILKQYATDRNRAHCPVFDAAWALDPLKAW